MELADKTQCSGCGACACICHNSAISMIPDSDGFLYPLIDTMKCIECGLCRETCPVMKPNSNYGFEKVAYGAVSNNDNVVRESSSGGIFTELSLNVLRKSGVVFGATYSDDYKSVFHTSIEKEEDLEKLRGSKYVQSDTHEIYRKVKKCLENDKYVLFSGVPCQVNALKQYLNKDYPKLLTVEVICHGVPSSKMHGAYIDYLQKKYKSRIEGFSQRYKRLTLSGPYYYYARFANGKEYKRVLNSDFIGHFYNRNLIYRPSCYNCQAKRHETRADITIGDFWGAEKYGNFKSGNSSIIVANSRKGIVAVEELHGQIDALKIDYSTVVKQNKSIVCSANMPIEREACMRDFSSAGFSYMVKKHYRISIKEKIKLVLDSMGILESIIYARARKN